MAARLMNPLRTWLFGFFLIGARRSWAVVAEEALSLLSAPLALRSLVPVRMAAQAHRSAPRTARATARARAAQAREERSDLETLLVPEAP